MSTIDIIVLGIDVVFLLLLAIACNKLNRHGHMTPGMHRGANLIAAFAFINAIALIF